jgi:hypothetical protein
MRTLIICLSAALLVSAVAAQDIASCSTHTTRGTYGFVCSGWISLAPNTPQVPFSALGSVIADQDGNFTGDSAKVSVGGLIMDWTVTTDTNTLGPDCSGTIVYNQKLNGQPAGKIKINYHVLDDGKEIRGMSVDTGSTISCNLRRIRK